MPRLNVRKETYINHRICGFTLIEVMIAVAIVGILASIAYSAYQDSVTRSRRAEGKAVIMDLANRMERYFIDNNSYTGATIANVRGGNAMSENGWYQLSISAVAATTYTIHAAPQNSQATKDATCGTLTLTQANVRGITGAGNAQECWRR